MALSGFQGGEPVLRDGWCRDWLREGVAASNGLVSMAQVPPCAETNFFGLVSDPAIGMSSWSSVRAS